jgi:hypothetical protein
VGTGSPVRTAKNPVEGGYQVLVLEREPHFKDRVKRCIVYANDLSAVHRHYFVRHAESASSDQVPCKSLSRCFSIASLGLLAPPLSHSSTIRRRI